MLLLFMLRPRSRSTSQHTYCTSNGAIMPSRKAYSARRSNIDNVTLFIGFTSQLMRRAVSNLTCPQPFLSDDWSHLLSFRASFSFSTPAYRCLFHLLQK